MAANDGASGVAVMLEVARLLTSEGLNALGVDFVCFDAEDWGIPQWSEMEDPGNTWALGAQYWAEQFKNQRPTPKVRFGILLDMVGGRGARFFQEGKSQLYANDVVKRVWQAADVVGFGSYFPKDDGAYITDDHLPVNEIARIPCIDIIPYYPDCPESSFGPTWHTVKDDMEHIDRNTLLAVGQTIVQVLFSE
jgi:Zn-dependent M28 family amino/carboxypeptidase